MCYNGCINLFGAKKTGYAQQSYHKLDLKLFLIMKQNGSDIQKPIAPDEKKKQLFLEQKRTLDIFLANGAITQAQYNKSYGDLVVLMGMQDVANELLK